MPLLIMSCGQEGDLAVAWGSPSEPIFPKDNRHSGRLIEQSRASTRRCGKQRVAPTNTATLITAPDRV